MIAFTICSNNYYAHAKIVAKSWLAYHPQSYFYIILVDTLRSSVNYYVDDRVTVIPIEKIGIEYFPELIKRYNIVELNTAIKPDVILYLFEQTHQDKIVYLDPDIQVYSTFGDVEQLLEYNDIIVTPHFTTPIDDGGSTTDFKMLGSGLFNLGFIALARYESVKPFLLWWRERLYKYCYYDLKQGMFYDQVWCNYLLVFFQNVHILKHPGYNIANWNFHERKIQRDNENWIINDEYPVRFIHFSGYKISSPEIFSFYHSRYTFESRPDFAHVFRLYKEELVENEVYSFNVIPCEYFEQHKSFTLSEERRKWQETPYSQKLIAKLKVFVRAALRIANVN